MNIRSQRGDWRFGPIAGLIIVILAIIGLFAVCFGGDDDNDPNSLGRIELISYRGGPDCYQYGDCSDHERRRGGYDNDGEDNRRAGISPGPFDRSPVDFRDNNVTICFPFSTCGKKDDGGDQQPTPGERRR